MTPLHANTPAVSCILCRDFAQVVQGIPEAQFQLRELLEVVAADVFVRHADAAVQLHRVLADEAHGHAELVLGAGHGAAPLLGRGVELERGVVAHGARQLQLHLHVGHAMAQRLEGGQSHAELLARVHVLDRHVHGLVQHAHGFGAAGGDADVHRMFERGEAIRRDQRSRRRLERDLGRAAAVLRAVAARRDAARPCAPPGTARSCRRPWPAPGRRRPGRPPARRSWRR